MNYSDLQHMIRLLILLISITITGNAVIAQKATPFVVADFLIVIETSDAEIHMKCNTGYSWKNLSFTYMSHSEPQAIDQYGMTTLDPIAKTSTPDDFMFTIIHSEKEGVILKGIKGTAWKELTYNLGPVKTQAINGYGMTSTD